MKKMSFIWRLECKVGSQEIPGVTGKFDFEYLMKEGLRLTEFSRECTGYSNLFPLKHQRRLHTGHGLDGQYEMILVIFFATGSDPCSGID